MNRPVFFVIFVMLLGPVTVAPAATSFTQALTSGSVHLGFRYRVELVDQNGHPDKAAASTLRTRLKFRSAGHNGFSLFAELDNVAYLGNDRFNNLRNGESSYPVVADPDGTDINQFYIDLQLADVLFRFGRQRINLDNQRFLGGVGWRQNEQTYDAATIRSTGFANIVASYTYIDNVSRIFGPDKGMPAKDIDSTSHILNFKFEKKGLGQLVGYGYFLDLTDSPALSNRTIGMRYSRTFLIDDNWSLPLVLEYASQQDYGNNPVSYSANYYLVEAGVSTAGVNLTLGYEILGGDASPDGKAFITPLATLHKFQGWNDKFLSTPGAGIRDIYARISGKILGTRSALVYHRFSAAEGGADYGAELDISVSKKISNHWSVLLKYSLYREDGFAADTTKTWAMITASF